MAVFLNGDTGHPNSRHTAGTMMILHIILHILLQFEGFVAKYIILYVKSSLCLQCALHLDGQCRDLKALLRFNTISTVPAMGASIVAI